MTNVEYALVGPDLEILHKVNLVIEDNIVEHIGNGWDSKGETYPNSLLMPGLVNGHTHAFDGLVPEYGVSLSLKEVVGDPRSEKYRILKGHEFDDLKNITLNLLTKSLSIGVLSVIDFKELDMLGAKVAKAVKNESPINYIGLGRLDQEINEERLFALKELVDGYGVSSISLGEASLELIGRVFGDKWTAIHISETLKQNLINDLETAISALKPKLVVHGTNLTNEEFSMIAERGIKLVVCPRSNMWFSVGIPKIPMMFDAKVDLLFGTDNYGLIDHNLWKEMEMALLISRLLSPSSDFSRDILKSATVHPDLGVNPIEEGKKITGIILNPVDRFEASLNKYMSLIKSPGNVVRVLGLPRILN